MVRSSNADGTELKKSLELKVKPISLTTQDKGTYIYFEVTPVAITDAARYSGDECSHKHMFIRTEVSGIISHDTTWDKAEVHTL